MSIVDAITDVFEAIGNWIVTYMPQISSLFYTSENGLTLLGTLAVIGLGISVFFLLMGIIQRFLKFQG